MLPDHTPLWKRAQLPDPALKFVLECVPSNQDDDRPKLFIGLKRERTTIYLISILITTSVYFVPLW